MKPIIALIALCLLVLSPIQNRGSDWPQFLGPNRDGEYRGKPIREDWPSQGPPIVWKERIGHGFSAPVVSGGRLILFHRKGNQEIVQCWKASDGTPIWSHTAPTRYRDDFGFDDGPRSTPAIADGRIYTMGAEGLVNCLDLASGKEIWSMDCKTTFQAPKGFFGMVCSPLVEGDFVILNIGGGNGAGIVAFDRKTGALAWKTTDHGASYSSPVATTIRDRRYGLVITQTGLVGLEPASGKVVFDYPWAPPMNASVSAATPLVIGDQVFISASYQTGAALLSLGGDQPRQIWASDEALSNHYATSVHHNGFLYGFHGRQEHGPSLRCVELGTGKVQWSDSSLKAGTVTLAGDSLLLMLEDGRLILAPASPERFRITAQAQVLPMEVRAHPALADGLFYARSKQDLVCVQLTFPD